MSEEEKNKEMKNEVEKIGNKKINYTTKRKSKEEKAKSEKTKDKKDKAEIASERVAEKMKKIESKKIEAVVNGRDLRVSTKEAVAVCNFIRNKEIERAIQDLEKAVRMKIAVPMKGEVPHQKGVRTASGRGRYPINTISEFLKLLKSLRANAVYNGLELEKFKVFCVANQASRPFKRFGQGRFKRSHVEIKLMMRNKI